jgi:hypothetical protein
MMVEMIAQHHDMMTNLGLCVGVEVTVVLKLVRHECLVGIEVLLEEQLACLDEHSVFLLCVHVCIRLMEGQATQLTGSTNIDRDSGWGVTHGHGC